MKFLIIDHEGISHPLLNYFFSYHDIILHNYVFTNVNKNDLSEYHPKAEYVTKETMSKEYDVVFMFIDPIKVIDKQMSRKWFPVGNDVQLVGNLDLFYDHHVAYKQCCDVANSVLKNKVVFIDTDDRARYKPECFDWFSNQCDIVPDLIFKKECRKTYLYSYDARVKSFPFITHISSLIKDFYLNREISIKQKINEVLWIGGEYYNIELGIMDEWVNRLHIIKAIEKFDGLYKISGLSHEVFLDQFRHYKMFLHLNGRGEICHRFYEGLSKDSLMICQEYQTITPFSWHDLCWFEHPDEYDEKVKILKSNELLYQEALGVQRGILDTYYNTNYISNYILTCLENS